MTVKNPATGEIIADFIEDKAEVCVEAVQKCREAQRSWAAVSPAERGKLLMKVRGRIIGRKDELARMISDCTGKTLIDALATEVLPSAVSVGYYVREGKKFLKPKKLKGSSILFFNKDSRLYQQPWGVVGIISPWNYPYGIPFHEVFTALVAGNGVVLKLASQAQPLAGLFSELFAECGLPEHLLTVINVKGREAGRALLDAGINKLFFTGSVAVGKRLMEEAAKTLTPVSLELGGNDGMIVAADANISRAAEGAVWAGISNCGQSCGGVERIYVHETVYDRFMSVLKEKIEALRQGPDTDCNTDLGSLTTEKQLETVKAHIAEALGQGAAIAAQSPDYAGNGFFHPAVVLENVNHSMTVMKEETFGPVLAVMKVASEEEAVRLTNDSNLGLTSSVWSKNRKKATGIAERIEAGAITLNDHLMSHGMSETPWGGFKESSIGRSHGQPGLQEMTQPKVIIHDRLHLLPRNIWWHPYSPRIYTGLSGALDAFYSKSPTKRITGLVRVAGLYIERLTKG